MAALSWSVGLAIALLLVSSALAELVVLYDSGQSWPIDRYLKPLLPRNEDASSARPSSIQPEHAADYLSELLPIRSPGLSLGPVTRQAFDAPVPLAFFMIGSDDESLQWLARHRDELKEQGAIGLLVDADDEADLKAVAAVAKGLPMTPGSGDDIGKALGVSHYPFAVTKGHIWQ